MPSGSLWRLEARSLLTGRAWLGLAVVLSLLVGSTFAKAVGIYTEGSRAALTSPDLAQGLNPFDGILVPTFGSAYLVATLLLPFLAIRQIGADRESGALKLLFGLGYSPLQLVLRKFTVLAAAWAIYLMVPLTAALLWFRSGGHLGGAELGGLWFGHFLYGIVVIALSMWAGSLGRSPATSSLLVLAATLGSWVMDFEGAIGGGWASRLASLSLTQALRPLERGQLLIGHILAWGGLLVVAMGLATIWLHPGRPLLRKVLATLGGVGAVMLVFLSAPGLRSSWDLTEDRRHSFPVAIDDALGRIPGRLDMEIHLSPEDPRWMDLDRGLVRKLQRVVPHLHLSRLGDSANFGRFSQGGDDPYGQVVYRYQGREDLSRSTSTEEILPLIWKLTGIQPAEGKPDPPYPGYPAVLEAAPGLLLFRVILPLLFIALWLWQHSTRSGSL